MATVQLTYTNEQSQAWGQAPYAYTPATTREIVERFTIANDTEATKANTITNARFLWVRNMSSTADNTLSVGLATGVYGNEIPPGATGLVWLVGKPTDPTLYFKFVNPSGGEVQYILRD